MQKSGSVEERQRGSKEMGSASINKVIDDFSHLPLDDKEFALDVIKKQLIEARREAIVKRAKEAVSNPKKGKVKKGTFRDLYRDLESD